jgi:hypothetical protein
MHIARIEGPAAGYALYLLGPGMEGTGEREGEWQNVQMIGEDIPFGNSKGMHVARIEGPVAGYALYLTYLLVMAKECIKPGLKVQRQGMRCISCALV